MAKPHLSDGTRHVVFDRNRLATARSVTVGKLINGIIDAPDAPNVRVHEGDDATIYLGAASAAALDRFEEVRLPGVEKVLDNAGVEQDLYIEMGVTRLVAKPYVTGAYVHVDQSESPYHALLLAKNTHTNYTAIHELVHAIRKERGWSLLGCHVGGVGVCLDEEIMTELETVGVVSAQTLRETIGQIEHGDFRTAGYYAAFADPVGAMLYDRILMTGHIDRAYEIDHAHFKAETVKDESNIAKIARWNGSPFSRLNAKTLPSGAMRRECRYPPRRPRPQRRVVTVRVSARPPRSKRLAPGAGERLFHALIGGKDVTIHATQGKGVTKADIARYLSMRLGARAVWECRGCKKVKIA